MWWITAGYLLVKGRWSHLKVTQALMDFRQARETSHTKSSLDYFQHQYLGELLVNIYSHHLMVKSVSCCCVRGSQFRSHNNELTITIVFLRSPDPSFSLNNIHCVHLVITNYVSSWSHSNAGIIKIKMFQSSCCK